MKPRLLWTKLCAKYYPVVHSSWQSQP